MLTWKGVLNDFKSYLGHENVKQIADTDVISWKNYLVAKGLKSSTINNSYLAGLRTILNFAVNNKLISKNPAEKIKVVYRKNSEQKQLPYNDEEVAQLLWLAKQQVDPARRWLPWLAALSGARIGELAQLWGWGLRSRTAFISWKSSQHRTAAVSRRPTVNGEFRYIPFLSRTGFWIS